MNSHVFCKTCCLLSLLIFLNACGYDRSDRPLASSVPKAPDNVTAAASDGTLTVSWSEVEDATTYTLYWSTSAGVTMDTGTEVTAVSSSYTLNGLINDTTYYVVVTAENRSGESAESDEASGTPNDRGWGVQSVASAGYSIADYSMWPGDIALNDSDIGFAVFEVSDGTTNQLYATRYEEGSWSPEINIGLNDSSNAQVVVDTNGTATVVWVEDSEDNKGVFYSEIWATRYTAGVWGKSKRISERPPAGPKSDVDSPRIAVASSDAVLTVDSDDNVIACWRQTDSVVVEVLMCNRYAGGDWETAQQVNDPGHILSGALAMDADGLGHVYVVGVANNNMIWAVSHDGTAWGELQPIGEALDSKDKVYDPVMDVNANGDIAVMWAQTVNDSNTTAIKAVAYSAVTGLWETPKTVAAPDPLWAGVADLVLDDAGNSMAFWIQEDSTDPLAIHSGHYAQYRIGTSAWSNAQALETSDYDTVTHVIADVDASGKVHVAWEQAHPDIASPIGTPVWVQAYDSVNGWSDAQHVGNVRTDNDFLMDVNNTGNALLYALREVFDSATGSWYLLEVNYFKSGN